MAVAMFGFGTATELSALKCKKYISAIGKASRKSTAKTRARFKWRIKARKRFGARYSRWSNALERRTECKKTSFVIVAK